jgi:hypothetical protein
LSYAKKWQDLNTSKPDKSEITFTEDEKTSFNIIDENYSIYGKLINPIKTWIDYSETKDTIGEILNVVKYYVEKTTEDGSGSFSSYKSVYDSYKARIEKLST